MTNLSKIQLNNGRSVYIDLSKVLYLAPVVKVEESSQVTYTTELAFLVGGEKSIHVIKIKGMTPDEIMSQLNAPRIGRVQG